jgi:hypothetical protein
MTSTAETTVKKPPSIKDPLTLMMFSGMSFGTGIKFKKPFKPNSKNIKPSNTRAMGGKNRVKDLRPAASGGFELVSIFGLGVVISD